MTKTSKPTTQSAVQPAAIVVFGLSAIGKPKAGLFKGTDITAATKAAAKLGLSVLDASSAAATALLAKVPMGRIQAHGDAIVPFVTRDLYAAITDAAKGGTKAAANTTPAVQDKAAAGGAAPSQPRLPADWSDIKIGDCVLSRDTDPADGWWQAIVVDKRGDIVSLRWPRSDRGRPFQKHRTMLGLMCTAANDNAAQADNKNGDKDNNKNGHKGPSGERYPKTWSQIGADQIVLAKEDGPCEQWWEAKVITIENDVATLQWRDYPSLPPILRPRAGLGLMHPAPKSR
jgi:hypothetical protein